MIVEQKTKVKGEVKVPGDRSISHRAIILGSLAQGTTEITGAALNEDSLVTIESFRKLGIGIEITPDDKIKVYGRGIYGITEPRAPIDIVNSGTTLRALTGILAGQKFNSTIVATERGYKRSMKNIVESLRKMGADIQGSEEEIYTPLIINPARLIGKEINIEGSGARLKSALLFASLFASGETKIIEGIKSRDHTEQMINYFGGNVLVDGNTVKSTEVSELYGKEVFVPGDTSYAVYFILAGLLIPDSEVIVKDVSINPTRMNIINILKRMGAKIKIDNERTLNNEKVGDIRAEYSKLKAVDVTEEELDGYIEEIPALMVAMTRAKGMSTLKVNKNVLAKENNRVFHMSMELAKMGAKIIKLEDGIEIEGNKKLRGTIIETYNDERIAMPIGVAGIIAEGETMIKKVQCVDVSFAEYFDILCDL